MGFRIITMPFHVSSPPEYLPYIFCSNVRCFGKSTFNYFVRVVPCRANFKYFDTLISEPIPQIEFITNFRSRSPFFNKLADYFFNPFNFKLAKCHECYATQRACRKSLSAKSIMITGEAFLIGCFVFKFLINVCFMDFT